MSERHDKPADAELWQRYRSGVAAPGRDGGCPELSVLAGYLDERLPIVERMDVERHLTACRVCRTTLDEARSLVGATADLDVPVNVVRRAQELVPSARQKRSARAWPRAWPTWAGLARWGVAAAAAIGIAIAGDRVGATQASNRELATRLDEELSFGLLTNNALADSNAIETWDTVLETLR